eukprot:362478-Chlamydomonas_euryale.AAC.13
MCPNVLFAELPCNVAGCPCNFVELPCNFAGRPCNFAAHTCNVAERSCNFAAHTLQHEIARAKSKAQVAGRTGNCKRVNWIGFFGPRQAEANAWQGDNVPSMAAGSNFAIQLACAGFPQDETRATHKPYFRIDVLQAHQRASYFQAQYMRWQFGRIKRV